MSEFIFGLLLLKSDAPKAQAALIDLSHPHILKDLNEKWSVLALEQPDDPAEPWILQHSHDFPMLWFASGDDSWTYIIFHKGAQKASIEINSALSYSLWRQIAELLYPDLDPHRDLAEGVSKRIYDLVYDSDSYEQSVIDQYSHANVDEFAIFGLSLEEIVELEELLRPDFPYNSAYKQVEEFKKVLSMEDMNWWMSYDALKRDQEQGRL